MTWRKEVYPPLANITLGFEQVREALRSLHKRGIMDEGTFGSILEDIDNLWDNINYVVLTHLHIRESRNQGDNDILLAEIEKVLEKLKKRRQAQTPASAPKLLTAGKSTPDFWGKP